MLKAIRQNINFYVSLSERFPDAFKDQSAFSSGSSGPQWLTLMMMMMMILLLLLLSFETEETLNLTRHHNIPEDSNL